MKKMWLLLALLAFAVFVGTGCALFKSLTREPLLGQYDYIHAPPYAGMPNREIPIWISHDIGAADQIEISKAVEQWNFVLNGYVHLSIVDTHFDMEVSKITESVKQGGWLIMQIDGHSSLIPIAKPGLWVLAFVDRIGGSHMFLVRERFGNEDLFGITMHEIGHLLGSPHLGHKLMYPTFSKYRYQCVDFETAAAVAEHQGIRPEDLNYCVDRDSLASATQKPSTSAVEVSNCSPQSDH
jgi:hypothetical protein